VVVDVSASIENNNNNNNNITVLAFCIFYPQLNNMNYFYTNYNTKMLKIRPVWSLSSNNNFHILDNITYIFTYFFTYTYFKKLQKTLNNNSQTILIVCDQIDIQYKS